MSTRFRTLRGLVPAMLWLCLPAAAGGQDIARYLPPPGATYVAEEVGVRAPGRFSLAGTLTLPTRGVLRNGHLLRYPAVILLSGAGPSDRDGVAFDDSGSTYRPLRDLADTLTRRGLAVLRLDDRGVGASTGTLDSTTTLDRADDARAAIAYLRRRIEIDPKRVAVLGMSEGASIAALVAATDTQVRGVVMMAGPGLPGREVAVWQRKAGLLDALESRRVDEVVSTAARDSGLAVRMPATMAEWDARAATEPWWRFYATYDPRVTARAVQAPALVVQGDADDVVPPAGADSLAAALRAGSRDVTLRHFAGIGHAFLPADAPEGAAPQRLAADVLGTIADWTVARLGGVIEGPAPRPAPRRRHRRH